MRYMLLIYTDPNVYATMSQQEQQQIFQEYFQVTKDMQDSGVRFSGEPLQPITTATTLRVKNGKPITSDGPFAETKEHLVGYYLIEAGNLDEALSWAAKIPDARFGSIEIRPIQEVQMPAGM